MVKLKQSLAGFAAALALVGLVTLLAPSTTRGLKAAPPTMNVSVANTEEAPVPVRDVDNPARRPVAAVAEVRIDPDLHGWTVGVPFDLQIPAGSRLVIERVSGGVAIPTGQALNGAIYVITNGVAMPHELQFTFSGSDLYGRPGDSFVTAESLRLYPDAGTNVYVGLRRNSSTGSGVGHMAISGYLVDVPQQ